MWCDRRFESQPSIWPNRNDLFVGLRRRGHGVGG